MKSAFCLACGATDEHHSSKIITHYNLWGTCISSVLLSTLFNRTKEHLFDAIHLKCNAIRLCVSFISRFVSKFVCVCLCRWRYVVWPLNCLHKEGWEWILSGKHWLCSSPFSLSSFWQLFFFSFPFFGFYFRKSLRQSITKIWQICCYCWCCCIALSLASATSMCVGHCVQKWKHWKCNPLKSTNLFGFGVVCMCIYVRAYEYATSILFWNKTQRLCSLLPAAAAFMPHE